MNQNPHWQDDDFRNMTAAVNRLWLMSVSPCPRYLSSLTAAHCEQSGSQGGTRGGSTPVAALLTAPQTPNDRSWRSFPRGLLLVGLQVTVGGFERHPPDPDRQGYVLDPQGSRGLPHEHHSQRSGAKPPRYGVHVRVCSQRLSEILPRPLTASLPHADGGRSSADHDTVRCH